MSPPEAAPAAAPAAVPAAPSSALLSAADMAALRAAAGPAATAWHALSVEATLAALHATSGGLSKPEAAARLRAFGANTMTPGRTRTLLHMVWDQLYNIITCILLAAAAIAGAFGEWVELGFILAVVLANVVIGVVQEGRAEAATKAIKAMVSAQAVVVRNRRKATVDAQSIMGLMMLAAGIGTTIEIAAEGPEAETAVETLVQLVNDRFHEER